MKERTPAEPMILAAAERQMQAWARGGEIADRAIQQAAGRRPAGELGEFITISREAGAGGSEVAEALGRKLNWEVLDKNLLDQVANRFDLSREMLKLVDETQANWAHDVLGTWLDPKVIPHEKYVVHLGCVILAAARQGNVVLVGRGAQFILPRERGLAVRIIAPRKYRVQRIMNQRDLSAADARRFIEEVDLGRTEFAARYFHHDIDDPHLYDLVINTQGTDPDRAAELIAMARGMSN